MIKSLDCKANMEDEMYIKTVSKCVSSEFQIIFNFNAKNPFTSWNLRELLSSLE